MLHFPLYLTFASFFKQNYWSMTSDFLILFPFRNCEIKTIATYGVFVEIAPGREVYWQKFKTVLSFMYMAEIFMI